MRFRVLYSLALLVPLSITSCLGLVIREDDGGGVIAGKVVARTLLALPTLGLSEYEIAEKKEQEEARPWMITSGSHIPASQASPSTTVKPAYVVWGNHPAAVSRTIEFLQRVGHPVVERSRLDAIFDEQKIRLMHTSEDISTLLRVGQLVGAGRIAFVEVETKSETRSGTINTPGLIAPIGGIWIAAPPRSENYSFTLHNVSVAVRGVNVEDGTVRWSGTAAFNKPINTDPGPYIGFLTDGAIMRALCAIEKGYTWIEQGPWRRWGCKPPQQQ